ncbi:MAG: PLP-dependent aminotransferase family protein [Andreesenia angusta]|nr:PLP-dependent aminotransferase family protein [Andreesenia angusta]
MDILTMSLDRNKGFYYEQIYEYIKGEIIKNNLECNKKLPSKRKLSEYLNISQNTVEMAYNQLIDEGYVYSKPRIGFYVSDISNNINFSDEIYSKVRQKEITKKSIKKYRYDFNIYGVDKYSNMEKYMKRCLKILSQKIDDSIYRANTDKGLYSLRKSISKYLYSSRGFMADPENIIISYGTDHLISILNMNLNRPLFAIENPGYRGITKSLDKYNIKYNPVNLDDKGVYIDSIPNDTNILSITPSHQFPTGIIYPINRRLELLNWAEEKEDRFILEDDYNSEFRYTGATIPSLKSYDKSDRVIYIGNFSKSISPSFKTSYMVIPSSLSKTINFNSPVSYINQKLLSIFIDEGYFEKHLNYMRNFYKKKRDIMVNSLSKKDIVITGQEAGTHLICDFKDRTERVIKNAERYNIKIYPISEHYVTDTYDSRILLGYATIENEDIEDAIRLLLK